MTDFSVNTGNDAFDRQIRDAVDYGMGESAAFRQLVESAGPVTITGDNQYTPDGSPVFSYPGDSRYVVNINPNSGAMDGNRQMTLPELIAHELGHKVITSGDGRHGLDDRLNRQEESDVVDLANRVNSDLGLPLRTDINVDGRLQAGVNISYVDFLTGRCTVLDPLGSENSSFLPANGHIIRPSDAWAILEKYSGNWRGREGPSVTYRNDQLRGSDESASDNVRDIGNSVDDVLEQGGAIPGAIGEGLRAGGNVLAGALDFGSDMLGRMYDKAAAAARRDLVEQNKDRDLGPTGGGGRSLGSNSGSHDDVKTAPKNVSTGGNFGSFGGGNGGSDNSGTHKGSAPKTSSTTGNGPGFSSNSGPVNSGTGPQNTSSKSSTKTAEKNTSSTKNSTDTKYGPQPILLDLDGDGVQITELNRSTRFVDGGEGLLHRTAWAAAGNGVLFFDPDGRNAITEKRQYVFTEWNPTASGDLEALRSVWDSNGDGKLTAADAEFAKFKVLVTNADGTTTVQTLTQLGITEINLTADTTYIELPDGSLITGQTTFTRGNGTTGTVANTTLISEAQGHRVVQSTSTDGSGNKVVVSTAYDAAGAVVYAVTSVTNPAGTAITNSYDDNGDGVIDRLQTVSKVTNANGSKTETLINKAGADAVTAILVNRTVTTTSADTKIVTIERDSEGGGWFDQREVRTTLADGSRTKVISDLAQSGAVIRSSSETVSINGRTRAEGVDEDGNGAADTTTTHVITVAGNNSRTEVTSLTNGNGSLRSAETETVSADGKVRAVTFDLDGNGTTDRVENLSIAANVGGTTTSTTTMRNGDNSLRNTSTLILSADALIKTQTSDVDGDGVVDVTSVETTTINVNGSRQTTLLLTNTDGSVRGNQKITLGADKVSSETWVDQNQDGVLQLTDLMKSVTVDAGTQARTTTVYDRNADGSVQSKVVSVTSANGLNVATTIDADGDGDTDTSVSDVTVYAAGIGTQTVITSNQDASLRNKVVTTTSANGLTVTQDADIDGNGTYDGKMVDARVLAGDGSVTRTVSEYAGNGTTLLGKSVTSESADRRIKTVTVDANGDGFTDSVTSSTEAADGSKTIVQTGYFANGVVAGKSTSTISANGLIVSTSIDQNGDLLNETVQLDTTTLNTDGSRTRTIDINNGDGSNRSLSVTTVSDDGLVVTTQTDANGDGVFERTSSSVSVLNSNGSTTRTDQIRAANGALLSQSQTTISDDGLLIFTKN
jgi:hypothetical protein